jgi:hypothetical protein
MPRRVSLPGASELFRATCPAVREPEAADAGEASAAGTGRVRHEEKITVYVSSTELIALERARLELRAEHGLAVDRGRIVRTAVSLLMADFEANGAASALVRTLTEP